VEKDKKTALIKGIMHRCRGLGAPIIEYLAAAGIGTLGIIDDDTVDLSNLQRQVIHAAMLEYPKSNLQKNS